MLLILTCRQVLLSQCNVEFPLLYHRGEVWNESGESPEVLLSAKYIGGIIEGIRPHLPGSFGQPPEPLGPYAMPKIQFLTREVAAQGGERAGELG